MKKVVLSSSKRFIDVQKLINKSLLKLNQILNLHDRYLEVYLIDDKFNVHSFPAPLNFPRPDLGQYKNLGEIYICPDYIKQEIKGGKWGSDDYFTVINRLLIHGLLHLLGYDHKIKSDRMRMQQKEQNLLDRIL